MGGGGGELTSVYVPPECLPPSLMPVQDKCLFSPVLVKTVAYLENDLALYCCDRIIRVFM